MGKISRGDLTVEHSKQTCERQKRLKFFGFLLAIIALSLTYFGVKIYQSRHQFFIPAPINLGYYFVEATAFSPNSNLLAVGSDSSHLDLENIHEKTEISLRDVPDSSNSIVAMSFSPDGKILAVSYENRPYTIQLWDVRARKIQRVLNGQKSRATTLAFSLDGKTLISSEDWDWETGTQGNTIRFWNTQTGRLSRVLKLTTKQVLWLAFSPNRSSAATLTTGEEKSEVKLWNLQTGQLTRTVKRFPERVREIAFSQDWRTLAVTGDHAVTLWNANTGAKMRRFKREIETVEPQNLVFSPDGTLLVNADTGSYLTTAWDHTYAPYSKITLWNISSGKSVHLTVNPNSSSWIPGQLSGEGVTRRNDKGPLLLLSPNGSTLVAGGGLGNYSGSLWLWDINNLKAQLQTKTP